VTTLPAKAGSFLRSQPHQQQLLGLRLTVRASTLASEGSVQAYLVTLFAKAFQVLRGGLPTAALELEVVKEQQTVPCRANIGAECSAERSQAQFPCRLNATVSLRNFYGWTAVTVDCY
jgi:hypothetical protein